MVDVSESKFLLRCIQRDISIVMNYIETLFDYTSKFYTFSIVVLKRYRLTSQSPANINSFNVSNPFQTSSYI